MSAVLYVCMVAAGITVHYLFALTGLLPEQRPGVQEMVRFSVDHTLFLNAGFVAAALALLWLYLRSKDSEHGEKGGGHREATATG